MSDAGTRPTYVSALYRPPMSGGLRNTSRKSSWCLIACRLLPGSVMAAMSAPGVSNTLWSRASSAAWARSQAAARKAFGSVVVPDLLAMMTRVVSGSRSSRAAVTASGSVESSRRRSR